MTKKFRASIDDTSYDVEVADAVSGQPRSNDRPRREYTPPGVKPERTEQDGAAALAGSQFAVPARREVAGDVVRVNDSQFIVSQRGQAIDVTHASNDAPAARAFVATAGDVTWVSIDGEVFTIDIEDAQRTARRPRSAAGEGLSAPMPATVIRVLAEPGREVKRGETLLLLEAMKMELPVRSPRDATVVAIKCREGELVQPGVPLLELDEA
jgi:biotin carboxyl carrier protein